MQTNEQTPITLRAINRTLKNQFQHLQLRPGQEEVIRSIVNGEDTLAILPTGAGKSLCYQLPAVHLDGVTVVISPLLSLIKDQRKKLDDLGISCAEFDSSISAKELDASEKQMMREEAEVIYVTPERFVSSDFIEDLKKIEVDFVVIDEAHCISQWGHDFRPAYLAIRDALKEIKNPPVLALTATATPAVTEDIQKQLGLKHMRVVRSSILRENLRMEAILSDTEKEKKEKLAGLLKDMKGSGIVYTSTVKQANEIHELLNSQGIPALLYHGKLRMKEREANQNEFMSATEDRIMIATNAFGMGIDKADIRFVIHFNFPGSVEAYYQEAGRAGRDGDPARCILLYLKKDKSVQALFLSRKYPSIDDIRTAYQYFKKGGESKLPKRKLEVITAFLKDAGVLIKSRKDGIKLKRDDLSDAEITALGDRYDERRKEDQEKLKQVIMYSQSALCRWKLLARYFEETAEWTECHHCDNCDDSVMRGRVEEISA